MHAAVEGFELCENLSSMALGMFDDNTLIVNSNSFPARHSLASF